MDLTSIRPTDTRRRTWVLVLLLLPLIPAMIIRASVDPTIEARRQRLATMPADQRARLLDKAARFDSLTDKQKAAIRQLHAQIEQRPDRDQLLEIMQGYSQWLATLSPTQRAELLELDTEQRVARIAELKRRYEEERIGQLLSLKLTKEQSREVLQ